VPGPDVLVALPDIPLCVRVAEFEIILEFIGVHNPNHGGAVLFHDKVLLVAMCASGHSAQFGLRFRERKAIDDGGGFRGQGQLLAHL
jgi:hypothetical protein